MRANCFTKPPGGGAFLPRLPELFAVADDILSRSPAWPHTRRVEGVGVCLARFLLPLEVCETNNMRASRQRPIYVTLRIAERAYDLMRAQHGARQSPLTGRPMVRCIRFSPNEPDRFADFAKVPVDKLCITKSAIRKNKHGVPVKRTYHGLGWFRGDSPAELQVEQWAEKAPRGSGFCLIEVWSGETL